MNLFSGLKQRFDDGNPIRIGLIGAGKFGSMFLAQARCTPGLHVVAIADFDVPKVQGLLASSGWETYQYSAPSTQIAYESGRTFLSDDSNQVLKTECIDVVIEATGKVKSGINHALSAFRSGKHVIMVTVEADAVAGALLSEIATSSEVIYSLAYGDQPAQICEHVDWARTVGFRVIAAGKGTRYHPSFHDSTPETVWRNFGIDEKVAEKGHMDPKMFNSFIDGSKSAIEMTAVCNATGLEAQFDGLNFPPVARHELAECLRPKSLGGLLDIEPNSHGITEVISSLHRDNTQVQNDLRMGTYVVVDSGQDYVRQTVREYGFQADSTGSYLALYRPEHLIGLELGISVASVALRHEPTGAPKYFSSDVVAIAKCDLIIGDQLDGEGGYMVWGKQVPAVRSLALGALPLGLAQDVSLRRPVKKGEIVKWEDIVFDPSDPIILFRKEMEYRFDPQLKINVQRK